MEKNRILIVVNSVYQLFTAVHMRTAILREPEADLLLTDVTPQLKECRTRLEETGLFHRILWGTTLQWCKKYAGAKGEVLTEGFRDPRSVLHRTLSDELGDYSEVYFSNFDPFIRLLACWFYRQPCAFFCYEDGFSSYVIDALREDRAPINRHPEGRRIREKLAGVLLYEPRLAMRGDGVRNLPLPKVRREEGELKTLLNHIFDYKKPEDLADFIFLEQSFRAEGIRTNDIALMRICQQAVGPGRFLVKPHPRNPENLPLQLGLTRKYPGRAPWELFLLNEPPDAYTVITVCSNAALTGRLVFDADPPVVMLYRLFEGKVLWKEDAILQKYLGKFHRQFGGKHYYVPKTGYELNHILAYLGGCHEQSD